MHRFTYALTPLVYVATLLALLCLVACGPSVPPEPLCGQIEGDEVITETIQASGLWLTDSTNLAPEGALQRADNAVLRDGFLEPARGFVTDIDFGTTVDSLYPWTVDGALHLLAHGSDNTLYRRRTDSVTMSRAGATVTVTLTAHGLAPGAKVALYESNNASLFPLGAQTVVATPTANTFTYTQAGTVGSSSGKLATSRPYSGVYLPPTGHPMRFWEAGGNLYFTTSTGPFRLDSPTATPRLAGEPPGLEGSTTVSNPSSGGWIAYGETVGYRTTWGKRTEQGRLILGAPSGRMLLTNLVQDATPVTGKNATRVGTTVTVTSVAHGLLATQAVIITASTDTGIIPLGVKTIATVPTPDTFTYTEAGTASSATVSYVGNDDGVRDAVCTTYIPDEISAGTDFCQFNRTVLTTSGGVDPGEDMALVGEMFPSSADITTGSLTFTDIAPFANGANAYFSPSEGLGGLGYALEQPPLIQDAVAYKDFVIGVSDQSRRAMALSLLATGSSGLNGLDGIQLTNDATTERYVSTGISADEGTAVPGGGWYFFVDTTGTAAANIENTMRSLVRVVNNRSSYWYMQYASSESDPPGKVIITERAILALPSTIRAYRNPNAWSPTLRADYLGDFSRVANVVTVDVGPYAGAHHLRVGEQINLLVGNVDFPAGLKTITSTPTTDTFTYAEVAANAFGAGLDFTNNTSDIEFESTLFENSWLYSATKEWDGFPPVRQSALGGPTNVVSRVYQFGDVAAFFSDEGLWRLTGTDATDFVLRPYPDGGEHVRLFAPNTVAKLPGGMYALIEDGVVHATEASFNATVGEPIRDVFRSFTAGSDALKEATKAYAFAVGNDSEQEYWLFLPDETASSPSTPTQAYVYAALANGGRGGWTRYIGNTLTGTYARFDQHMYLAPTTTGPILRERRDRAPTDFRKADGTGVAFTAEYVPFRGSSPSVEKQWVKALLSVENSSTVPMPAQVGMYFSTSNEAHATFYGNAHDAFGDGIYTTYTPLDVCRGNEMGVRVTHSTAGEWLRIKSMVISYNQAAALRKGK